MGAAYAALGNGGTVVTPHLGDDVESVTGSVLQEIRPAPRRHLDISHTTRDTIMTALTRAATDPGGAEGPSRQLADHARHDHDRPHPGCDGARRDLLSGLRQLPVCGRGQDGN